jgi:hypothetical protein
MALVTIASAKGSPGVTTTALALGALWPRPVMVAECDTSGGDIATRMPRVDGAILDPDRGLLSLAAAGRKGLSSELVATHTQQVIGGLDVLVGPPVPEQAAGLANIWPMLGPAFDGIDDLDVVADLGRIGANAPQEQLIRASRLLILVCRADASAVIHVRERIAALAPRFDPGSPVGTPIAVAVVADAKARHAVGEVAAALEKLEVPIRRCWHIALDERGAGFFNGRVVGRADKTALIRTAHVVADEAAATVATYTPDDASTIAADAPQALDLRAST